MKSFHQMPLVRTVRYTAIGGLLGMIVGLILALFGAGVTWAMLHNALAGQTDFTTLYAGFSTFGMLFGGLITAVMCGIVAVRMAPTGDMMFMGGCDESCEGCPCCEDEDEDVVMVEAPKL